MAREQWSMVGRIGLTAAVLTAALLAASTLVVRAASTSLIIERFTYQATGISEYVKIKNISGGPLDLADYRLGDAETAGGSEGGLYWLPAISLAAGASIVIARDADDWSYGHPAAPDYSFLANDVGVPQLVKDSLWSSGSFSLSNTGDEVVLVDENDGLVDGVCYGTSTCNFNNSGVDTILIDGPLVDLPSNEAGYRRATDVDTDTGADWAANPTAISLVRMVSYAAVPAAPLAGIGAAGLLAVLGLGWLGISRHRRGLRF